MNIQTVVRRFLPRAALLLSLALAVGGCDLIARVAHCPAPGQSAAFVARSADLIDGEAAVGVAGDYMLRNDKAVFLITQPDSTRTYYHYGGILADAAPAKGCGWTGEDEYEELGMVVGNLNIADPFASVLRVFRGEKIEIINDGTNGEAAHIRVTGTDDYYWLVEYELIKMSFEDGKRKELSRPLGIEITVDFRLPPDSGTLQIEYGLRNLEDNDKALLTAALFLPGDRLTSHQYAQTGADLGGFSFSTGIPWIAADRAGTSYAFAMPGANMAGATVSGMQPAFDLDQALTSPLELASAGSGNDKANVRWLFAVGEKGSGEAVASLLRSDPELVPDELYALRDIRTSVQETGSKAAVKDVLADLQMQDEAGIWLSIARYYPDDDGKLTATIPVPSATRQMRWQISAPGRKSVEADTDADHWELGLPGSLHYAITDSQQKAPLPARIQLYRNNTREYRFFVFGTGTEPVEPGIYDYVVDRGFEYEPVNGTLEIKGGQTFRLEAELDHVVDTSGFLSGDTHVHSAPSPDSTVPLIVRVQNAAAVGLEVPVATDHEIIVGLQRGIEESGLQDWVASVIGEEMTASIPEHMTMFPVVPDNTNRGGPIKWYGKGIEELTFDMRDRGAEIIFLNHPNYMKLIGWDYVRAQASLADPTLLGLKESTPLWTWDLDGFEYQNGAKKVFGDPTNPKTTGLFERWMSFLNHGYKLVAVGASDSHGLEDLGLPRTYFETGYDDVRRFRPEDMVKAYREGKLVVSTGAFARFSLNDGTGLGQTLTDTDGSVRGHLKIEAIPQIDVSHFKVFVNCDQVLDLPTTDPDAVVKYDDSFDIPVPVDAHIVVLGFGKNPTPRGLTQYNPLNVPRFTTNAIYVDTDGNGSFDAPGDKSCTYTRD